MWASPSCRNRNRSTTTRVTRKSTCALRKQTPRATGPAPITYAEGLRGDLLIIVGTGETNTHVEITEGLVDRLIELGKRFDYFAYPNRDHGLHEGQGTEVHLRMLIIRYLVEHLPAGPR